MKRQGIMGIVVIIICIMYLKVNHLIMLIKSHSDHEMEANLSGYI